MERKRKKVKKKFRLKIFLFKIGEGEELKKKCSQDREVHSSSSFKEMRKITKPAQKCNKCDLITKGEKWDTFCDEWNCQKKIIWNRKKDIPFNITFLFHSEKRGRGDFDFCSARCEFKWLLKNAEKKLKHRNDFFSLEYWNKGNIKDLLKCLNRKKLWKKKKL